MREYHFNGKYNKWALGMLIKDQILDALKIKLWIIWMFIIYLKMRVLISVCIVLLDVWLWEWFSNARLNLIKEYSCFMMDAPKKVCHSEIAMF